MTDDPGVAGVCGRVVGKGFFFSHRAFLRLSRYGRDLRSGTIARGAPTLERLWLLCNRAGGWNVGLLYYHTSFILAVWRFYLSWLRLRMQSCTRQSQLGLAALH